MATRYHTATAAFEQTLEQLDLPNGSLDADEQVEIGRRGALLATAMLQWEEHLGPLLDWRKVATLMGTVSTRQGVNDLAKRNRLLALRTKGGHVLYPLFQFRGAKPFPELPTLLEVLDAGSLDGWSIASWFVTGQPLLGDESPAGWLKAGRDPAQVFEAAERVAERLAH
ncbi:MAG: hypothetical protein ACJ760_11490 [Thermoleophilaceae bacterium]